MLTNPAVESGFDIAAFLAKPGLGRTVIELQPKQAFFRREIWQTAFFIFKRAAPDLPSFLQTARKPR
jgi:hypothetical protein